MKNIFSIPMLLLLINCCFGQSNSQSIFRPGDRILAFSEEGSKSYYSHTIKKGESLYAISQAFNASLDAIYDVNNLSAEATLSVGQAIKVPITEENLYKGVSLKDRPEIPLIPVFYTVQKQDNLFRLSKIYFNQSVDAMMTRNHLSSNLLDLGQELLVGWLQIGKHPMGQLTALNGESQTIEWTPPQDRKRSQEYEQNHIDDDFIGPVMDVSQEDTPVRIDTVSALIAPSTFDTNLLGSLSYNKEMKEIRKAEVAHWDKTMFDNGAIFVLHKTALLESYVELYNPLVNRSVRAKVIGRIPYGTYMDEVSLVLSPHTAKQLGAKDRRFKVIMKMLVKDLGAE